MILLLQLFGVFVAFVFAVAFTVAMLRIFLRKQGGTVQFPTIFLTAAFWALGVWQAVTYWGGAA